MKLKQIILIPMLIAAFLCAGFATTAAAADKTARIAYVEWSSATASANVVKAVLQTKMGYKVELLPVSAAAMWQSVATGDVDFITAAWLPTTHAHYYAKVKNEVVDVRHNLVGTKIGLVVPDYVTIKSIGQLNKYASKFDNQIVGIDPGAGIMSKTEKAIKDYHLTKMKLMDSSGAMMTAVLKDKIAHHQWVVVTGWTPHWMFGKWQLKYLKDPKDVYGGSEYIDTIARKNLKKDKPELYAFLTKFHWNAKDMEQVMAMNQEKDTTPYENAVKWIKEHPDLVKKWLP